MSRWVRECVGEFVACECMHVGIWNIYVVFYGKWWRETWITCEMTLSQVNCWKIFYFFLSMCVSWTELTWMARNWMRKWLNGWVTCAIHERNWNEWMYANGKKLNGLVVFDCRKVLNIRFLHLIQSSVHLIAMQIRLGTKMNILM